MPGSSPGCAARTAGRATGLRLPAASAAPGGPPAARPCCRTAAAPLQRPRSWASPEPRIDPRGAEGVPASPQRTRRCVAPRAGSRGAGRRTRAGGTFVVHSSLFLRLQPQDAADHAGDALPVLGFRLELLHATRGDGVELRPAVVLRRAPGGRNPALLLQPQKRGVDGAFVEPEDLATYLLDPPGDAEPVHRSERMQGLQDHQVQRALQHFRLLRIHGVSEASNRTDVPVDYPNETIASL